MRSLILIFLSALVVCQASAFATNPTCTCSEAFPDCCTFTKGFWCHHRIDRPPGRGFPWPQGAGAGTEPCLQEGKTFTELNTIFTILRPWRDAICWRSVRGDACIQGAAQFIATRLNICNGSCASEQLIDYLATAEFILNSPFCPGGLTPRNPAPQARELRRQLLNLTDIFASFNEGFFGPGSCDAVLGRAFDDDDEKVLAPGLTTGEHNSLIVIVVLTSIILGFVVVGCCMYCYRLVNEDKTNGHRRH